MQTDPASAVTPPMDDPAEAPASRWRSLAYGLATMAAVTVSAAMSSWLVLRYPLSRALSVPTGSDTPSHLWRARIVYALGLPSLFGSSPFEYHANSANPDRVGLPVLGSLLGSVVHVGPWRLMFIASALGAAILAFSAWALARAMGEPRWAAPIYAAIVGMSVPFALTAPSHLDNALADATLVALAAVAVLIGRSHRGIVAGVVFAVVSVLLHWPVGILFIGLLGVFTLGLLPRSLRLRREGTPWWTTPAARAAFMTAAAGVCSLGALLWTPGSHVFQDVASGCKGCLHLYGLPYVLPLAAAGAVFAWFAYPRLPHRLGLLFYASWSLLLVAGLVVRSTTGGVPIMRVLAVALWIPLLVAAAAVGLIRVAASPRGVVGAVLAAVAAVVVIAGVVLQAQASRAAFELATPMTRQVQLDAIRPAMEYLRTSAPDRNVVFVVRQASGKVPDFAMVPAFRRLRAFAPGWYVPRVATYLGLADQLLDGKPTRDPTNPKFDETSLLYWGSLRPWLSDDTVVMVLAPFYDRYENLLKEFPDAEIAPGVAVLVGPDPVAPLAALPPLPVPTLATVASWTGLSFLVLLLVGTGWCWGLLRLPWDDRLAFAPALGLGMLVIAGFVIGMRGVILSGGAGRAIVVAVALAGWLVAGARWAWDRRTASRASTPDPAANDMPPAEAIGSA